MKRLGIHKKLQKLLKMAQRSVVGALLIAGLAAIVFYKQPIEAASKRGKTAAGIILGGGAGAGIAGAIGGAKWLPLGFGVGGLAGFLLVRAVRKNRQRKRQEQAPYGAHKTKRDFSEMEEEQNSFNYRSSPHKRRHVRMPNQ